MKKILIVVAVPHLISYVLFIHYENENIFNQYYSLKKNDGI